MRKFIKPFVYVSVLLVLSSLLILLNFKLKTVSFSAPELFGDGGARLLSVYPPLGLIRSGDSVWLISGQKRTDGFSCSLYQVAGEAMIDYDESGRRFTGVVPCYIRPIPGNQSKFSGWIFFRTHKRKFCGALDGSPPSNCFAR